MRLFKMTQIVIAERLLLLMSTITTRSSAREKTSSFLFVYVERVGDPFIEIDPFWAL